MKLVEVEAGSVDLTRGSSGSCAGWVSWTSCETEKGMIVSTGGGSGGGDRRSRCSRSVDSSGPDEPLTIQSVGRDG